jgi:hypothetical protein
MIQATKTKTQSLDTLHGVPLLNDPFATRGRHSLPTGAENSGWEGFRRARWTDSTGSSSRGRYRVRLPGDSRT